MFSWWIRATNINVNVLIVYANQLASERSFSQPILPEAPPLLLYFHMQMVTRSNNSRLKRTGLCDVHICSPLLCVFVFGSVVWCLTPRLLEDLARASSTLMDGAFMQSSCGADAGREMKRSLHQPGMWEEGVEPTEGEGRQGGDRRRDQHGKLATSLVRKITWGCICAHMCMHAFMCM